MMIAVEEVHEVKVRLAIVRMPMQTEHRRSIIKVLQRNRALKQGFASSEVSMTVLDLWELRFLVGRNTFARELC